MTDFNSKRRRISGILLVMIVMSGFHAYSQTQFQTFVRLNRGRMWYDLFSYGGHGDRLPNDRYSRLDYPGCAFTAARQVYNPLIPEYPGMDGYMFAGEVNDSLVLYRIPFRSEWFRPHEILEKKKVTLKNNLNLSKEGPEQSASGSVFLVYYGLEMSWTAMVWSAEKYDDFIIWEYTFSNPDTGASITGFRFARACEISIGCNTVDNASRRSNTEDDYFEWDPARQLFYFRDGIQLDPSTNQPVEQPYGWTGNDQGEPSDYEHPASITHDFKAPQYLTFAWLSRSKEPGEPDHMNCTARWFWPQPPNEDEGTFWWFQSGTDDPYMLSLTYDEHPPLIREEGTPMPADSVRNTPRARRFIDCYPLYIFETGPYDIAPGEKLKLVLATVGGHMEWERVANLVNNEDDAQENARHLIDGRAHLFANLDAARELMQNQYSCPCPPPTPTAMDKTYDLKKPETVGNNSLLVTPLVNACKVQWYPIPTGYKDRDYAINDVAGYRIYRSRFDCFGPWERVLEIPADSADAYLDAAEGMESDSMMTFVDADLDPSRPLHYVVTAFDTGHDAPWKLDRTGVYATLPSLESAKNNFNVVPVFALGPADNENFRNTLRVYPNPFKLHSQIPNEQWKLDFVNVPSQCTIRIYTLAGDLVNVLEHNEISGVHEWASTHHAELGVLVAKGQMLNRNWQRVVPGIYIFHVESHAPGHEGESKIGKFVVIR
ncbi:hypothetical protein JW906_13835 [bacterium]|nr:hypothetical protein [bacterium]